MVIKIWTKGQSTDAQLADLTTDFPVGLIPKEFRIIDSSEIFSYEDETMDANQKGATNATLNNSGWTDTTP